MFSKYAVHKKFEKIEKSYAASFTKMNCSRWCWQTQFWSAAGFGNKMKLKSRLLPFSLIFGVNVHFVFSFVVFYFLSKFWYMLTVRLCILGHSKFHVWDHVLCWLAWNYHWNSLARYAISGQSDTETKSPLPDTDSLGSTNEPLLVESVGFVILHTVMQRCGQNGYSTWKMQYLCKILQWAWPLRRKKRKHCWYLCLSPWSPYMYLCKLLVVHEYPCLDPFSSMCIYVLLHLVLVYIFTSIWSFCNFG